MTRPTLKEVREISIKERFYPYVTWLDHIFSPASPYLAWIFIRLNISANGVSWISGFSAMQVVCFWPLILLASSNWIFWVFDFYQLDYVDGTVARLTKKTGVGGQYIDFIMHVVSHVSIMAGLAFGAISQLGSILFPLAILAIVAAGLNHARHSIAWFAIVMEQQKRKAKGLEILPAEPNWVTYREPNLFMRVLGNLLS